MQPPLDTTRDAVPRCITLFLCGDVMTGRGIDQILLYPGRPTLHEPSVKDATVYVDLAERQNGPIPWGVDFAYIWGDTLKEFDRVVPDLRIINLETAVTSSDDYWVSKGVHYRMHPKNAPCLTAAGIDCCVLANNHVLDWGYAGLEETLHTLEATGITTAGAGRTLEEAQRPAVFELPNSTRVLLFSLGSPSSGIPFRWDARDDRPGVHLVDEVSPDSTARLRPLIERYRWPGDLVIVSIHWGSNWDYEVPQSQQDFAHDLIDHCGVDVVHGHSSHQVKGIEVYRQKPILYGCGDFLTDYEGIKGHEHFRGDLGLMYFVRMNAATQQLVELQMVPTKVRRLQVTAARSDDVKWLVETLNREGRKFATRVEPQQSGLLLLRWD